MQGFDPFMSNFCDLANQYLTTLPIFKSQGLLRLAINEREAGWLEPDTARVLTQLNPAFEMSESRVTLRAKPDTIEAQMSAAALHLREVGLIKVWRNECYAVHPQNAHGEPDLTCSLFKLERGAFRRFGLTSQAAHINGICTDGTLWIARRSSTKGIDPNRLDNLAAGGIPYNESPFDCAIRELAEEAGLSDFTKSQLQLTGQVHTRRNEIDGTHDEILHCYDLTLSPNVQPVNQDGEVAEFLKLSPLEAAQRLSEMTWDAGLVTANYLLRQKPHIS
ncbi:DUF4743 domain-containing protein [Chitinibacter sp. SCUT-21]|uniref:NUDIX hydrolase n=1 Tax=Chitinibacter sp. SCUT-21 TaxID=2970891 RepID=UPI0035A6C4C6